MTTAPRAIGPSAGEPPAEPSPAEPSTIEPSTTTARTLVTALVAHGVRDVVLAPGSRSAPLAYALLAAERVGWIRLHVRIDERVAGFVALGLARAAALQAPDGAPSRGGTAGADGEPSATGTAGTGGEPSATGTTGTAGTDGAPDRSGRPRPVAVVTTSGTAVANLHPAVLEAAHSGLPLVVVSADRPHEMRGTGANQTTDQVGIFASATRFAVDIPAGAADAGLEQLVTRAVAAALGVRTNDPGPVHLDVGFRDPLVPATEWEPGEVPPRRAAIAEAGGPAPLALELGPRTVVVAGDGAGRAAREVAEAGGWPLLAEPTSGARAGANAIGAYRLLLQEPTLTREIERVVVFGHPTLSRPVSTLLARADARIVVVAPRGPWTDVAGVAVHVAGAVTVVAGQDPDSGWLERWRNAGAVAQGVIDEIVADLGRPLDGLLLARHVAQATGRTGDHAGILVVGSSNTVRDLDLVAPAWDVDGVPVAVANRGLAGIDGTIGTATGLALGTGEAVRAVMGDLTFLHDAGALLRGELEDEVDLQVVVLNDHGGGIFATLEHGAPERAGQFERIFGTPQSASIAQLAAGYGCRYTLAEDRGALRSVLAEPVRGRSVVEVPVDRSGLRDERAHVAARVRAALTAAMASGSPAATTAAARPLPGSS
ncbi:MAG: 2-succinyl-5-enolpyruvyl-6-hydroxy-3-cyclohexene-1-carboxylic-acid synthase [Georgenia sp.]